jgi:hypothetical protein
MSYFKFPIKYANNASAMATMTIFPIARPSCPSVKLTALELPTINQENYNEIKIRLSIKIFFK